MTGSWQVVSRHIHRRIVSPDPRRDPGPGRVDHLHDHTPVALSDSARNPGSHQLVARLNIEYQSIWGASHAHQMEVLQTDEQITPITTIKRRRAAAGRVRHRPRSLTTAGVEVRSSSKTSTSTRNPRPTPGHPHSTRKIPETSPTTSPKHSSKQEDSDPNYTPNYEEPDSGGRRPIAVSADG